MKITALQRLAYDEVMTAMKKLHRLLEPIEQDEVDLIQDELREDTSGSTQDVGMALLIFEGRECDEETEELLLAQEGEAK